MKSWQGGGVWHWERVHSFSFCRSITVVHPCNPIKHTTDWLLTWKADQSLDSWCGTAQHRIGLTLLVWYLGSRWQLAKMEGAYSKHGERQRARVRCNLHSQKMSPVRLFSAYRNQVMESHLYFTPCLTFGSFPSLVFCISHSLLLHADTSLFFHSSSVLYFSLILCLIRPHCAFQKVAVHVSWESRRSCSLLILHGAHH